MLYKGRRLFANVCADKPDPRLFVRNICHGIAESGVSVGPMLRENFFLQLVFGGRASFDGQTVARGDLFLMRPGTPHSLRVDSSEPFEQYWFEVGGEEAGALFDKALPAGRDTAVLSDYESLRQPLLDAVYGGMDSGLGFLGLLFTVLSRLSKPEGGSTDSSEGYVLRAMEFLRQNCQNGVSASDAAANVGLSEKYLCRLFREKIGTTPTAFLQSYRLSQAKLLLSETELPIASVAAAIGFSDQTYFSRFFKERCKVAPSEYRLSSKQKNNLTGDN